jgi:L-serine/L-threonine ammonia-lyase
MALHIQTPLVLSNALSKLTGKNIWLKLDALQPSGSFKNRGVGFACEHYASKGAKRCPLSWWCRKRRLRTQRNYSR